MAQEDKKVIKIVRQRTIAGCLIEGWRLLADNIWNILRLSWPLILAHALLGGAVAINQHPDTNSKALFVVAAVMAVALWLVWVWHTAVMLRRYNAVGFFPATSMLNVWKDDGASTACSCMRQIRRVATSPRHWSELCIVVLVALMVKIAVSLLFAMPLVLTSFVYAEAVNASCVGDAINLPAYITWLYPLMAAVSAASNGVLNWIVTVPLAFVIGNIISHKHTINSQNT